MIKCNRCGMINAANAAQCQSCGLPLAGNMGGGAAPGGIAQDQSGLPAWLESLRAGERSMTATNASPAFPSADLAEDGALPSWMRSERDEAQGVTGSSVQVSLRSPMQSAPPNTPNISNMAPPSNIAARSLVDEQALPSWMQEGAPDGSLPPQEGISASSLVQPEEVPDWMKSLQPPRSAAPAISPRPAPAPATPVDLPSPSPSGTGFSARDLIDQQSLPSWMTQQSGQPLSPARQVTPPPAAPLSQTSVPSPSGTSFSARDLIDQQSLPSWMIQQSGQSVSSPNLPPAQPGLAPVAPMSQTSVPSSSGFSARDLIDQQSLPSWMAQQSSQAQSGAALAAFEPVRQGEPQPQAGGGLPASSLLDMNSLPPWLRDGAQGQPAQSPLPSSQPGQGVPDQAVAASSFIDVNALPEWMRGQGNTPGQAPAPVGPPRVENVRVPSRPRGDINASETSEVAANVFSSMLGVSSAAPNYPVPQPGAAGQPYPQGPQGGQPGPMGYNPGQAGQPGPMGYNPGQAGQPGPMGYNPGQGGQPGPMGYNPGQAGQPGPMGHTPGQSGIHGGQMGQPGMPAGPNMGAPGLQAMPSQPAMPYPGSGNQPGPGMVPNTPSGIYGGMPLQPGYNFPSLSGIPNPAGPGASIPGIPATAGNSYSPYPGGNQPGPMNNPAMRQSQAPSPAYSGMGANMGQPPASDQKPAKKRGIVGALLDWLAR